MCSACFQKVSLQLRELSWSTTFEAGVGYEIVPATMTIPYYEFSWWIIIQLQTDWQFRRNHFHLYFVWTFFVSYDFLHIQSTRVRATYSIGTAEIKRAFFPLPVNIFKSILKYLLKNGRIRTVSFSRSSMHAQICLLNWSILWARGGLGRLSFRLFRLRCHVVIIVIRKRKIIVVGLGLPSM